MIAWDFVIPLAAGCFRVTKDSRLDQRGSPRHQQGWHAWCKHLDRTVYRIDFNLVKGEDRQDMLEVVTVMEVG